MLFHPGLGHKTLKDGWIPTMELLLQTRKPVLCTAHSAGDLLRDENAIKSVSASMDAEGQQLGEPLEMIFQSHRNPFASSRRTHDKEEVTEAQIVTTNEFIHAFRAK